MKFTPNIPFESKTPTVVVDAGMEPGSYLFRLVVEDESGNRSRPDDQKVVILRTTISPRRRADISSEPDANDDTDSWPTPDLWPKPES